MCRRKARRVGNWAVAAEALTVDTQAKAITRRKASVGMHTARSERSVTCITRRGSVSELNRVPNSGENHHHPANPTRAFAAPVPPPFIPPRFCFCSGACYGDSTRQKNARFYEAGGPPETLQSSLIRLIDLTGPQLISVSRIEDSKRI